VKVELGMVFGCLRGTPAGRLQVLDFIPNLGLRPASTATPFASVLKFATQIPCTKVQPCQSPILREEISAGGHEGARNVGRSYF
jgi:hypothetical protein